MSDFDAHAAEWDSPMRTERARQVAEFIRNHLKLSPGIRLLDIGAGTGVFGLSFYDLSDTIVCIDTSAGMLAELRKKVTATGLSGVQALEHDISSGPVVDGGPFDLAVSLMAFHHIVDYHSALVAIRKSLGPEGTLCLVDLDREDGLFHGSDVEVPHLGFERETLGRAAVDAGFRSVAFHTPYTITKDTEKGERDFPLFLMVAEA